MYTYVYDQYSGLRYCVDKDIFALRFAHSLGFAELLCNDWLYNLCEVDVTFIH